MISTKEEIPPKWSLSTDQAIFQATEQLLQVSVGCYDVVHNLLTDGDRDNYASIMCQILLRTDSPLKRAYPPLEGDLLWKVVSIIVETIRQEIRRFGDGAERQFSKEVSQVINQYKYTEDDPETVEKLLMRIGHRQETWENCIVCAEFEDASRQERCQCHLAHKGFIMFEPCGHVMCKPCFHIYYEHVTGESIKPCVTDLTEKDNHTDGGFQCHMCRGIVKMSFDPSTVSKKSTVWKTFNKPRVEARLYIYTHRALQLGDTLHTPLA
jgi:hypothetical protein